MKSFVFHREADEEFFETLCYYNGISPELGNRFYDEIHRLITDTCRTPATFRFIRKPVRRHFSRNFPYSILYTERPDDLLILAVMHLSREPGYWTNRIA